MHGAGARCTYVLQLRAAADADLWALHCGRESCAHLASAAELCVSAALRRGYAPAAGRLLTAHHAILRDILGTSTPRIDALLDAACAAGAWGGKINGSGGGGTCVAYCAVEVAEAVERAVGG